MEATTPGDDCSSDDKHPSYGLVDKCKCKGCQWIRMSSHPDLRVRVDELMEEYRVLTDTFYNALPSQEDVAKTYKSHASGYNIYRWDIPDKAASTECEASSGTHLAWQEEFMTKEDVAAYYLSQLTFSEQRNRDREMELWKHIDSLTKTTS